MVRVVVVVVSRKLKKLYCTYTRIAQDGLQALWFMVDDGLRPPSHSSCRPPLALRETSWDAQLAQV